MPPTNVRQLSGVDVVKFVMAFAVIAIHVEAVASFDFPEIIQWFIALAVPFFFITSGYLLGRKLTDIPLIGEKRKFLSDRSCKLFRLFAYWLIIYLPISIYLYSLKDDPLWKDILSYIGSVIINGESRYAWPLWFIYSMAIVLFILSKALFRKNSLLVLTLVFILVNFVNSAAKLGYAYSDIFVVKAFNILTARTLGGVFISLPE